MLRNFSKLLCSPSVVVRFSYYEKYQNSIGLNQTEVYFPYTGIQTAASQGDSVVCAVGKVKPLLSGCSGPSPCVFCLTVPEGCCSSYHHISHPSGQQQEAGKKKCVCGGEWVGGCSFFFCRHSQNCKCDFHSHPANRTCSPGPSKVSGLLEMLSSSRQPAVS